MRYSKLTMLIPCALPPVPVPPSRQLIKITAPAPVPVSRGPDSVAQQFYDYRIQHRSNDITALRPYLSDKLATLLSDASRDNSHRELLSSDPFSSRTTLPDSAHVASASTIPNRDARNIPLRVDLKQGDQGWQDEVLMIQEGQCWVIDDVRYLGGSVHATAGTLRQSIENR